MNIKEAPHLHAVDDSIKIQMLIELTNNLFDLVGKLQDRILALEMAEARRDERRRQIDIQL